MENDTVPDGALALQWVFGAFVVFLYARDRFHSPGPMRATTTFWRYWAAWSGYIMAMLALFIVLGGGFTAIPAQALLNATGMGSVEEDVRNLPAPLLSALVLTDLLPHFPLLGKIDQAVMLWFQRVGNIPLEGRFLARELCASGFAPSREAIERLAPLLRTFGAMPAWIGEAPHGIRCRFARAVILYGQIQGWEAERAHARYFDENREALAAIRERLDHLAAQLDRDTIEALDIDVEGGSTLATAMRRSIGDELDAAHRALCDFISGGVLHSEWKRAQRLAALRRFGFTDLSDTRDPLTAHDIVLVTGLIFLVMLFVPLMLRRLVDPTLLPINYRVIVMVPIIYAIAIVVAIYPKAVWPFAARTAQGGRPIAAYALSGVIAAAAAFAVTLLFRYAFDTQGNILQALSTPDGFIRAWEMSVRRWPWMFMTLFCTIAIAWAADDHVDWTLPQPKWLRAAETVALAGIFGTLQWAVLQLLVASPAAQWQPSLLDVQRIVGTAFLIGALIGAFVPHLYRQKMLSVSPQPGPSSRAMPAQAT